MKNNDFNKKMYLRSEKSSISEVEPLLNEACDNREVNEKLYFNILVALTEAVNNAIIHGNRSNPEKKVEVAIIVMGKKMELSVKDFGDGFVEDELVDPRNPENLLKDSGRGVFIIKSLADNVSFINEGDGTKVKMSFRLDRAGK